MPVTADQVAALRAHLFGDFERYQELVERLDRDAIRFGFNALIAAAFCVAVERRFSQRSTTGEVVEFVGRVRQRFDSDGETVDPKIAERVIWAVLGEGSVAEVDAKAKFGPQIYMLTMLIDDEQLDEAGMDHFLAEARELASEWVD